MNIHIKHAINLFINSNSFLLPSKNISQIELATIDLSDGAIEIGGHFLCYVAKTKDGKANSLLHMQKGNPKLAKEGKDRIVTVKLLAAFYMGLF